MTRKGKNVSEDRKERYTSLRIDRHVQIQGEREREAALAREREAKKLNIIHRRRQNEPLVSTSGYNDKIAIMMFGLFTFVDFLDNA